MLASNNKDTKHSIGSKQLLFQRLLLVGFYVISLGLFTVSLIHFTNLRSRVLVDPIGVMITKINMPREREKNIIQANYHIGESERLTKGLKQQSADNVQDSAHGNGVHAQKYRDMLAHNDEATRYMLSAEELGADLKKEGLIKRLCDSLRDQYLLITGEDRTTIDDSKTLNARVGNGENLQVVFDQIQKQLEFAMSW